MQTSSHDIKKKLEFREFLKAQAWSLKRNLPIKVKKLMQLMVKEKTINAIYSKFLDLGGDYEASITEIHQSFNNLFYKGANRQAIIKGIAYPKYVPKCQRCCKPLDRLAQEYCSKECKWIAVPKLMSAAQKIRLASRTAEEVKSHSDNIKKANLIKYGYTNPAQVPKIKNKIASTIKKRSHQEKEAIKEKRKDTFKKKYGDNCTNGMHVPSIRAKQLENVRKVYRADNDKIQHYRTTKMLKTHGVTHQIHRKEIRDKINRYRVGSLTLGDKTYTYQGYENYVLEFLHCKGYQVSTEVLPIKYLSKDGTSRKYYPDIKAIKGKAKLLVEVKSSYTLSWTLSNCPEKLYACTAKAKKLAVDFLVIVVYPSQSKMLIFRNPVCKKDFAKGKEISY